MEQGELYIFFVFVGPIIATTTLTKMPLSVLTKQPQPSLNKAGVYYTPVRVIQVYAAHYTVGEIWASL